MWMSSCGPAKASAGLLKMTGYLGTVSFETHGQFCYLLSMLSCLTCLCFRGMLAVVNPDALDNCCAFKWAEKLIRVLDLIQMLC
jgi:hypothetical protein